MITWIIKKRVSSVIMRPVANIVFSYSNIFIPIRIFTYFLNEYILIYSTVLITVLSNNRYVRKDGGKTGGTFPFVEVKITTK